LRGFDVTTLLSSCLLRRQSTTTMIVMVVIIMLIIRFCVLIRLIFSQLHDNSRCYYECEFFFPNKSSNVETT